MVDDVSFFFLDKVFIHLNLTFVIATALVFRPCLYCNLTVYCSISLIGAALLTAPIL